MTTQGIRHSPELALLTGYPFFCVEFTFYECFLFVRLFSLYQGLAAYRPRDNLACEGLIGWQDVVQI